jgi:hypothetical protein
MVNPDAGVLFYCPNIVNLIVTESTSIQLYHPAPQDCLFGTHKRKFNGQEFVVNGNRYRMECKLVQKTSPLLGMPNVKIKGTFTKKKNNIWKKSKPIDRITLKLRGDVYSFQSSGACNVLFKQLDDMKTSTTKKELRIERDLPGFSTNRNLPYAVSGDFIWFYSSSNSIGNYNEVIKP